jgi:hypothetical protein
VHPPHPFEGFVTSTIQCGARNGFADAKKVFQSARDAGEKIFMPAGQEFFCVDL